MKTQTKILFILIFSFVVFIIIFLAFSTNQTKQNNLLFESVQKQQNAIINSALNNKINQVNQVVSDYSLWDDLGAYVNKPDKKWEGNVSTVLESFNFDFLFIYNIKKELIYFKCKDTSRVAIALANLDYLDLLYEKRFINFYKNIFGDILQINGATIHSSSDLGRKTPPQGFFIVGKFWNKTDLANLSASTSCLVKIELPHKRLINKEIQKKIVIKKSLVNEKNQTVFDLIFIKENTLYESYKHFSYISNILFISLLIFILSVFYIAFNQLIKRPLNDISESLTDANSNKINKYIYINNEFGQIARLIKDFYIQIKKTEESEEKFRALAANIPGIVLVHQHEKIIYVNDNVKITGYTPQEVINKNILSFLPENNNIKEYIEKRMLGVTIAPYEIEVIDKKGGKINMLVNADIFNYGKEKAIIVALTDITERKNTTERLRKQSILLQGVAQATNHLLMQQDLNQAITNAIDTIGKATNADRVYIFENHQNPETGVKLTSQRYKWIKETASIQINNPDFQHIIIDAAMSNWDCNLMQGKTIKGAVKDFSIKEKQILDLNNIKTILITPIFVNNKYWGFIGIDNCSDQREWDKEEESMLITLSASIGSIILRKKTEDNLLKAMKEAQSSTEAKSAFLATMSHEIRTPMNGVIGMTSLLLQTKITPEQHEYLNAIRISGNNLLNIINDILDFSKIESNKMILEEQPFDINKVMEDVVDILSLKINDKKLEYFYLINPDIKNLIIGDISRLRQILVNLIENAIKFTNRGGVSIYVNEIKNINNQVTLIFKIKDTGIGISDDKLKNIFQPFTQADSSISRKFGGTGLGLVISQKLVELMGGKLTVESIPEQGSMFSFTIQTAYDNQFSLNYKIIKFLNTKMHIITPLGDNINKFQNLFIKHGVELILHDSLANFAEYRKNNKNDGDVCVFEDNITDLTNYELLTSLKEESKKPFLLLTNNTTTNLSKYFDTIINKPIKYTILYNELLRLLKPTEAAEEYESIYILDTQLAEKHPLNILVAEDNIINQKLVTRMFDKMGYQVDIAANGIEVIQALERQKYNLIFMDVQMPEMDGLEATRIIKKDFTTNSPTIIAITANAMQGDKEICFAAGMDDYISKPIKIEEVELMIKKWGC